MSRARVQTRPAGGPNAPSHGTWGRFGAQGLAARYAVRGSDGPPAETRRRGLDTFVSFDPPEMAMADSKKRRAGWRTRVVAISRSGLVTSALLLAACGAGEREPAEGARPPDTALDQGASGSGSDASSLDPYVPQPSLAHCDSVGSEDDEAFDADAAELEYLASSPEGVVEAITRSSRFLEAGEAGDDELVVWGPLPSDPSGTGNAVLQVPVGRSDTRRTIALVTIVSRDGAWGVQRVLECIDNP